MCQRDASGNMIWRKGRAKKWDPESQLWEVELAPGPGGEAAKANVHRMMVLFDAENPLMHAERLSSALKSRVYHDSILRYRYL